RVSAGRRVAGRRPAGAGQRRTEPAGDRPYDRSGSAGTVLALSGLARLVPLTNWGRAGGVRHLALVQGSVPPLARTALPRRRPRVRGPSPARTAVPGRYGVRRLSGAVRPGGTRG